MGDRSGLGASERRGARPVGMQAPSPCLSGCRHRPPACRAAGTVPLPVGMQAPSPCLSGCRHRPPACRDAGTVPLPVGMQASFSGGTRLHPSPPSLSQHALPVWLTDSACRGRRVGFGSERLSHLSFPPLPLGRPCVKAVLRGADTDSGSQGAGALTGMIRRSLT